MGKEMINFKIKVPCEELKSVIEERLTELGYRFNPTGSGVVECMFGYEYGKVNATVGDDCMKYFESHGNKEIQVADLWSDMVEDKKGIEKMGTSYDMRDLCKKLNEVIDYIRERQQ